MKKYNRQLLENIKEMTVTLRFLKQLEELGDISNYSKDKTKYTGIVIFINLFEIFREDNYIHTCRLYLQFNKSITDYCVKNQLVCIHRNIT